MSRPGQSAGSPKNMSLNCIKQHVSILKRRLPSRKGQKIASLGTEFLYAAWDDFESVVYVFILIFMDLLGFEHSTVRLLWFPSLKFWINIVLLMYYNFSIWWWFNHIYLIELQNGLTSVCSKRTKWCRLDLYLWFSLIIISNFLWSSDASAYQSHPQKASFQMFWSNQQINLKFLKINFNVILDLIWTSSPLSNLSSSKRSNPCV